MLHWGTSARNSGRTTRRQLNGPPKKSVFPLRDEFSEKGNECQYRFNEEVQEHLVRLEEASSISGSQATLSALFQITAAIEEDCCLLKATVGRKPFALWNVQSLAGQ